MMRIEEIRRECPTSGILLGASILWPATLILVCNWWYSLCRNMQLKPSQMQCTHQLSWPRKFARSLHGLEGTGSHDLKQGIPCNLSLWLESLALTRDIAHVALLATSLALGRISRSDLKASHWLGPSPMLHCSPQALLLAVTVCFP